MDSIAAIGSYGQARIGVSLAMVKKQIEAEQAMLQLIMEASRNVQDISRAVAAGARGTVIDITV